MKRLEHGIVIARTEEEANLLLPDNPHSKIGWELSLKLRLPQFNGNNEKGWLEAELVELVPAAEVQRKTSEKAHGFSCGSTSIGEGFPLPDTVNTY